jgi:lipoprotein NlpI
LTILSGIFHRAGGLPALAVISLLTVAPAFADAQDGEVKAMTEACANPASPNDQVLACTRLIETRLLQGKALAQALYQRGLGYAALGQYQTAARDFDQALKFAPEATDARFNRGAAFSKLGKWDQALADFDALLVAVPNDPNTLYARAWVHSQRGEDDKAIADLDQVLAQAPDDVEALVDRGGLNIRAGRYAAAVKDFSALLKLEPKSAAAAYNRGRAHYSAGEFKAAAADFTLTLKLRSDNPYAALRAHLAQGRQAGKLAKDDAALKAAAEKLEPEIWPRPLLELFLGTGTPEALLAGINQVPAKLRGPALCEANYYLGERAQIGGDQQAARKFFQAAIDTKAATQLEFIDAKNALKGE